ncbi:GNAT family N-acetyltransferase [Streptomyces sp. TP-A0874]|uniref:GNAT family N-acetyltransferase n=1 Tax=Streptomyces sp. TP-A0874 TaxID=549819 RepID=UPI000853753A|nr:GNAT family protein [Streptomyces sp. TP-A0874]
MRPDVTLRPLDAALLEELLATAVADAEPREVMPATPGPPGWTPERRTAFLRFHRSRALAADPVEATYAVLVGRSVVGAARLRPVPQKPHAAEAGIWLGRPVRGVGVGGAALRQLVQRAGADGFRRVLANTKAENTAAQRLLVGLGAEVVRDGDSLSAWLETGHREPLP